MYSSKKTRGRPPTFNKEATISRAMECYWNEGLGGLSINELCRRINISKPAIYREFGGQDGLLSSVIEHYIDQVLIPLMQNLEDEHSLHQQLLGLIESITAPSDQPTGCLLVNMWLNSHHLGPQSTATLHNVRTRIEEWYLNLVLKAKAQGTIRSDIDYHLAAKFINTQLTTVLIQMNAGEKPEQIRAEAKLAVSVLFE